MFDMNLVERGSRTAKDGFRNEDDIIRKFNNWSNDNEAKEWLLLMNYIIEDIEYVKAEKLPYYCDIELEYQIAPWSNSVKEVATCRAFCRQILM